MKNNLQTAQGIISILAIICLAVGWFNILPPASEEFVSKKLFYILIGISFIVQGRLLMNTKFMYPMYIAAALCIVGAFLPAESSISGIKTIGLLAGVIISFANRSTMRQ